MDTCTWKNEMEKKNWKVLSWKIPHEIGKNEVGKVLLKLERSIEVVV